mgnify:CR=1 FL=1
MPYNGLYKKEKNDAYKISRSKIDYFLNCPRCFYMDRVLGIPQPPGFPFNLNSAVDHLLKKEFDIHRVKKSAHPLMDQYGIDAVPFSHEMMDKWRENFHGVQYLFEPANLLVFGAVDDIWINPKGELIVVDYKATAKDSEVTLDAEWQIGYKRQMEIYQWLLKKNGFKVSKTGYFVYANGDRSAPAFDGKLEFKVKVIPYIGKTDWIEGVLIEAKKCLESDKTPDYTETCDYCKYQKSILSSNLPN